MNAWVLAEWVGRIAFVALFIASGINHLVGVKGMAGYAQSKHVPAPAFAVLASGLLMLAGGVMILAGWYPVLGSLLLVLFLVPAAVLVHNFWTVPDPMARANEMAHFMKDIALAGAALLYAVCARGA